MYLFLRPNFSIKSLNDSKYFSKLDRHHGYWQVGVDRDDRYKTVFSVGYLGFCESNRLGMGLTTVPAFFQELMEKRMGDMH